MTPSEKEMTPLEAAARAIAQHFIPAYADDTIWKEDLPYIKKRGAISRNNYFGLARPTINAYLEACAKGECRDWLAEVVTRIASDSVPGPRDIDVAIDAIFAALQAASILEPKE